jgi:two-component system chemotaxis response regulator CheB
MKILIVEDDHVVRLLLKKLMKSNGIITVEVTDGQEALHKLTTERFDGMITDWMMPKIDGVELIEKIRKTIRPQPFILMITAIGTEDAKQRALSIGADAFLSKPYNNEEVIQILNDGILRSGQGNEENSITSKSSISKKKSSISKKKSFIGVGIATSTGGPQSFTKVLPKIPTTENAAFFMVQHGPKWMLESYVNRLRELTPMKVLLGEDNMKYVPGVLYVAPGDIHMILDPTTDVLRLINDPPENYCRPAADPLFRSIAASFGPNSIGVVMTGMGRDGSIGSGYIKAAGGNVMAQDPESAILASMPKSIVDLRIATHIVPLDQLGEELGKLISSMNAKTFKPKTFSKELSIF